MQERKHPRHRRAARQEDEPDWASLPLPGSDTWGAELAEWRLSNGVHQAELAKILGAASRDTVASWERRGQQPKQALLERLEALKKAGPKAVERVAKEQLERKFSDRRAPE